MLVFSLLLDCNVDDDDDYNTGDCLVADCSQLSIKSYWLGSAPNSPVVDVSWSLDASRLITVNDAVRRASHNNYIYCFHWFIYINDLFCV